MASSKSRSRSKSSGRSGKRERRSRSYSSDRHKDSRPRRRTPSRDRNDRRRDRRSRSGSPRRAPKEPITQNKKLFVTNIDGKIPQEEVTTDLRNQFQPFGKIVELIVKTKANSANTYAFIEYENVEDAVKAVEAMKNKMFKGKQLKVEFGRSQRKNDRQTGGCFNCHKDGHFARQCGERDRRGDRYDRYDRRRSHSRDRYRRRRYSNSRSRSSSSSSYRHRRKYSRSRSPPYQDYRSRKDSDRYAREGRDGRDRERRRQRSPRY